MTPDFKKMTELQKLPNIGKTTEEKLLDIEVDTFEELKKLKPEGVFLRIFEKYGWQKGMCSCFLYALEGAITGKKWNKIPEKRKKELCAFVKEVRQSLIPPKR